MATYHRAFGEKPRENAPKHEITFDFRGQSFKAAPAIPGYRLMEYGRLNENDTAGWLDVIYRFFPLVLGKDWERFEKVLDDPEQLIDIEELVELFSWLVEAYSGRPFATPSPSSAGPTASTDGSTDDSSSPEDTTSPASEPIAG